MVISWRLTVVSFLFFLLRKEMRLFSLPILNAVVQKCSPENTLPFYELQPRHHPLFSMYYLFFLKKLPFWSINSIWVLVILERNRKNNYSANLGRAPPADAREVFELCQSWGAQILCLAPVLSFHWTSAHWECLMVTLSVSSSWQGALEDYRNQ